MKTRQPDEGISLLKLSERSGFGRWRLRNLLKNAGVPVGRGTKITRQQFGEALLGYTTDEPRRRFLVWRAYGPLPRK